MRTERGPPRTDAAGLIDRLCFFSAEQVGEDEHGAAGEQHHPDENGTVAEEFLRHHLNDLVGVGIKEPVVLAGEEDGVENHKGPVKVQRRQPGHYQNQPAGTHPGPEAGAVAQQGTEDPLLPQPQDQHDGAQRGGDAQHPEIRQKEPPHVGKVAVARLRPGQLAGAEGLAQHTVVQHLVIGLLDDLFRPAGPFR